MGSPRASLEASAAAEGTGLSWLLQTRWLRHNLVVAAGVVVTGLLGFAFQSMGSHLLPPGQYAGAFAVLALAAVVGPTVSSFNLLLSRATSEGIARGDRAASAGLLVAARRRLLLTGVLAATVLIIASPVLAGFTRVPVSWIVAGALGTIFQLATPPMMGALQGAQRFYWVTFLWVGQALAKLAAGFVLGRLFGGIGIVAGVGVAGVAYFTVASLLVRHPRGSAASPPDWRKAASYLVRVAPATLAISLLLTTDIVMAKHFFTGPTAGQYSAVAVLGRAIYWAATGISAVLFPKVVTRDTLQRGAGALVAASIAFAIIGGLAGLAVLSMVGAHLLTAFAGPRYAPGAAYLGWYALGMTLLGGSIILITTEQSRASTRFLWVLLPLTVIEPALIMLRHSTPMELVQVVDLTFATLLVGMAFVHLQGRRAAPGSIP